MRYAETHRKTKETDIKMALTLDGDKRGLEGSSGIGFFDHMLNSFAFHGGFHITLDMTGDLDVDGHHTIEDVGIVLGTLFKEALGDRSGIKRFGNMYMPMDEALAFCAVDISGRPFLVFDAKFDTPMIGAYDSSLTVEFFRALAYNAGFTLHLRCEYGDNAHHITEALFKAAARAVSQAASLSDGITLSTKGVL